MLTSLPLALTLTLPVGEASLLWWCQHHKREGPMRNPGSAVVLAATTVVRAGVMAGLVLSLSLAARAQAPIETPPAPLKASAILPADVVKGPNHQVAEDVVNDGYVNHYRIGSDVGNFTAVSTAALRMRVLEINAMVAMEKIEGTSEFATSFAASAKRTVKGIENLVTNPGETISGAVSGVSKLFDRAGESLFGSSRSQAEASRWQDVVGYAKAKREVAHRFGVDVYSSNTVLQDHLTRISEANYWGGMAMGGVSALVPGAPGLFLTVTGTSRLLNDVIATTPPTDLRQLNREKLTAMNVDPSLAELFINNTIFSPRQQTVLVGALEEMKGTADRAAFVKFAVPTHDADLAFFRQRMAEMYAGYARNVGPVARFLPMGDFVAARTTKGALVTCLPLDHLLWTDAAARVLPAFGGRARELKLGEKHLWLTGTASTMTRQQLLQQGWTLHEQSEAQLWARK